MRLLIGGLAGLIAEASHADQIPNELRGNSVVLSWSESRVTKNDRQTAKGPSYLTYTIELYISSKDRFFTSFGWIARNNGKSNYEINGSGRQTLYCHFESVALVCYKERSETVALQIKIQFSNAYRQCSIEVLNAKKLDAAVKTFKGSDIISLDVLSTNCAVQPGNVFSQ
jgi:hypothetical protein